MLRKKPAWLEWKMEGSPRKALANQRREGNPRPVLQKTLVWGPGPTEWHGVISCPFE